ncbi:hypothetical protein MA16_Dca010332 [Dendrobium catenatum]|uniref:Uncharacterized protein n=1 Tax=Dendrobium catenatum TaxID=906689 RepID=A0A2I0X804_9ASPA|nr:hypothetical protein MA16_Dca010332 [Dendrobium catenatum]
MFQFHGCCPDSPLCPLGFFPEIWTELLDFHFPLLIGEEREAPAGEVACASIGANWNESPRRSIPPRSPDHHGRRWGFELEIAE